MSSPVFVGDEITAAGFRLAGVRIRTPDPADLAVTLDWAQRNASLIMITAEFAALLDQGLQTKLLSQLDPPVVIIPDVRAKTPVADLATTLRSQLGVLE